MTVLHSGSEVLKQKQDLEVSNLKQSNISYLSRTSDCLVQLLPVHYMGSLGVLLTPSG